MIFLTVGTQLPFDRLTRAVDEWAAEHPDVQVFGQVGDGAYQPKHMQFRAFISPRESEAHFRAAEIVVAHAGMGSIITALQHRKPIVVVPRRSDLGEHRNDHQVATVRRLAGTDGLSCVSDTAELAQLLDARQTLRARSAFPSTAPLDFTSRLRAFIDA